jgi:hypothetical protein
MEGLFRVCYDGALTYLVRMGRQPAPGLIGLSRSGAGLMPGELNWELQDEHN